MKNKLIILSVFCGGIIAGFFIYHFLLMNALPLHRQFMKIELASEEEFRATREERKGNDLFAILHRWNAVRLNNPEAIKTFTSKEKIEADEDWYAPIALISIDKIFEGSDPEGRGAEISEAIQKGHLAYLLEKNGYVELATTQWQEAANLSKRDIKQMKSLINKLREQFNKEMYKKAEGVVLGSYTLLQQ